MPQADLTSKCGDSSSPVMEKALKGGENAQNKNFTDPKAALLGRHTESPVKLPVK